MYIHSEIGPLAASFPKAHHTLSRRSSGKGRVVQKPRAGRTPRWRSRPRSTCQLATRTTRARARGASRDDHFLCERRARDAERDEGRERVTEIEREAGLRHLAEAQEHRVFGELLHVHVALLCDEEEVLLRRALDAPVEVERPRR